MSTADTATIRAAIFDVIDGGYQCELAYGRVRGELTECNLWHPWQFRFTVPETDEENQRRAAFVDSVIARIAQIQVEAIKKRKNRPRTTQKVSEAVSGAENGLEQP